MKRVVIFLSLLTLFFPLNGQINKFGVPLIRNYNTQITQGSEQNWCITKDIFGNLYFGNNNSGVIVYDGTKWSRIQVGNNPRIFSLESDSRGIIYVGAAFEFGYIQPAENGMAEYVSLASRVDTISEIKIVYSIIVLDNKVFFQSARYIYIYDTANDSLEKIDLLKFNLSDVLRLVKIDGRLILSDNNSGIFELRDTTLIPLPGGDFFREKECTVLLPFGENKILIGTFFDGLFLYDYSTGNVNSNFINRSVNDKLREVNIYAGAKIRDDLFAIGTTNQEGIMVFDRSGKLVQQIKAENSDLADNTILAMYCDFESNSELWISTQGVISKAYVNILTEFAEKQGIALGVNEICEFNGNLYISSDAGVLKSIIDKDNFLKFTEVPGINTQVFPLQVIESRSGDILLAGSLNGLLQVSKSGIITKVETNCINFPFKNYKLKASQILQSSKDPSIVYIGQETGGVYILRFDGNRWFYNNKISTVGSIYGLLEEKDGGLWVITDDPSSLYRLKMSETDTALVNYGSEKGIPAVELRSLEYIRDELYLSSSIGILKYDTASDRFSIDNSLTAGYSEDRFSDRLFVDSDGDLWYSGTDETVTEVLFRTPENGNESYSGILRLLPNVPLLDFLSIDDKIYLLKSKKVFVVDKSNFLPDSGIVNTSFVRITVGDDSVVMNRTFVKSIGNNLRIPVLTNISESVPEFRYDMNDLSFEWTTSYFTEELLTEYSYKLEGFDEDWSEWVGISYGNTMEAQYPVKEYTNLRYGHYSFNVRSRTLTGLSGNELQYKFIILKPWYARIYAIFLFALAAYLIILVIIKTYTKKLKNENLRLEGIVAERTAVVVKQKEELEASIHYASRIQMALLPSEAILFENIKNYFVLFKPRDIVSGDFYWMTKKGERLYIVAADCTGHGVPGAFMSLLGMSFLDEIIDKNLAPRADDVLKELRLHVTESLKQVGGDDEAKDGMDIALLIIDFGKQQIEFSGAYNPCFRVRKLTTAEMKSNRGESMDLPDGSMSNGRYLLETIYASKMPIGISSKMDEGFIFHNWALEKGISYYMFSDGYIDQFGGPNNRKFMKKNFKRFILEIQDYPMSKQKELLDKNLKDWMGSSPQIDDILVMGIRTD